jgi:hypothetical protein
MTVSMHENMLERRDLDRESARRRQVEQIGSRGSEAPTRLTRLVQRASRKLPISGLHLRRHGLTVERVSKAAVGAGRLPADRLSSRQYLDHISALAAEASNISPFDTFCHRA